MQPWDEMFDARGEVRPGREGLAAALDHLGTDELLARARLRDAHLSAQGITFTLSGRERPLPMDLVPRIVDAAEWQVIEAGRGPADPGAGDVPGRHLRRRARSFATR